MRRDQFLKAIGVGIVSAGFGKFSLPGVASPLTDISEVSIAPHRSLTTIDQMLMDYYLPVVREYLNQPILLFESDKLYALYRKN